MPLVAHSHLPSFTRLKNEGEQILSHKRADAQAIRELHIGLLNIMPDAALEATERQFLRLIGHSNNITQFFVHPFTIAGIKRGASANKHLDTYYQSFDDIKRKGLDALIITGANVSQPDLEKEAFYQPLAEVLDWAYDNVTSTLCSCMATHIVMQYRYQQKRTFMPQKCWGVFDHKVNYIHPLVRGVNTVFDVPHSRFHQVSKAQFETAGLSVLVSADEGVHLAVSEDLLRLVLLQGHPEYDTVSLLKEYKRELRAFMHNERIDLPEFPAHYLNAQARAILTEFSQALQAGKLRLDDFPEALITPMLNNSWRNSASAVMSNWIGCVYQVTDHDRRKPFMKGVDKNNPLKLK